MSSMKNETISQEIIRNSNKTITVTDDLGRVIVLRKPKLSSHLQLLKALGGQLSQNQAYVETVGIVSTIVSIDGQPEFVKALVDVEFLIRKLEESDDALEKIAKAVMENFVDIKSKEEYDSEVKK